MVIAKWMKKLNKDELAHLAEYSDTGRPTLRGLKFNLEHQKRINSPCYDCEHIARKLSIPIPSDIALSGTSCE